MHPQTRLQVKGALDSDAVKGSWTKSIRSPGNLGLPRSCVLSEDGHILFSSADSMENPAESLHTLGKNTLGGVFNSISKQQEEGKMKNPPIVSTHPATSLGTAPSCPARPAPSLWIVLGRQETRAREEREPTPLAQVFPGCPTECTSAELWQSFGASHGQEHVEGRMRSCFWGRTHLETALGNTSLRNTSPLSSTAPKSGGTQSVAESPPAHWSHTQIQPERCFEQICIKKSL